MDNNIHIPYNYVWRYLNHFTPHARVLMIYLQMPDKNCFGLDWMEVFGRLEPNAELVMK